MPSIRDCVAFVEGLRNGERFDESDIKELVENFRKYRGFWQPYVSVDHENNQAWAALSFGNVVGARLGRVILGPSGRWEITKQTGPNTRAALILDADNVPEEIAELLDNGQLRSVSVEFFDHTAPFVGPDDKPVMTNVLKSVSLLGAQSESSKGMPKPRAFADRSGKRITLPRSASARAKRFGAYPMMTREELLAKLAEAGVDTNQLTDAIPDTVLQMLVDALDKTAAPAMPDAMPTDPQQFGDCVKKYMDDMDDDDAKKQFADSIMKHAEPDGDEGKPMPKQFGDRRIQSLVDTAVKRAVAPLQAQLGTVNRQALTNRQAKIKAFADQMTGVSGPVAYMTPAQFKAQEPLLASLDDVTVRKFADGKTQGTPLDEALARLKAAYNTPVRKFGDQIGDSPKGGTLTPERRAELLSSTPEGKLVLAREKKS